MLWYVPSHSFVQSGWLMFLRNLRKDLRDFFLLHSVHLHVGRMVHGLVIDMINWIASLYTTIWMASLYSIVWVASLSALLVVDTLIEMRFSYKFFLCAHVWQFECTPSIKVLSFLLTLIERFVLTFMYQIWWWFDVVKDKLHSVLVVSFAQKQTMGWWYLQTRGTYTCTRNFLNCEQSVIHCDLIWKSYSLKLLLSSKFLYVYLTLVLTSRMYRIKLICSTIYVHGENDEEGRTNVCLTDIIGMTSGPSYQAGFCHICEMLTLI